MLSPLRVFTHSLPAQRAPSVSERSKITVGYPIPMLYPVCIRTPGEVVGPALSPLPRVWTTCPLLQAHRGAAELGCKRGLTSPSPAAPDESSSSETPKVNGSLLKPRLP